MRWAKFGYPPGTRYFRHPLLYNSTHQWHQVQGVAFRGVQLNNDDE